LAYTARRILLKLVLDSLTAGLAFSTTDLVRLTNVNVPAPTADSDKTLYKTPEEIKVRLMESSKIANQYKEERGYISDDEDSWYNIRLRYNRLA
jgi:hypothetical protein